MAEQPYDIKRGLPTSKEPVIEKTQAEDIATVAGMEIESMLAQFGSETQIVPTFAGIAEPVDKGYRDFEVNRLKIEADPMDNEKRKEHDIGVKAKTFVEDILKAEAHKSKLEEDVAATDASLLKVGFMTRPESIPEKVWDDAINGLNQALEGKELDALQREAMYREVCGLYLTTMPWQEKAVIASNIAALEARQVFNDKSKTLEPFVKPALVREMRMGRARLTRVEATKKRDERARLASAIGSIVSLARQRVSKYVPASQELQTL